MDYKTIADTSKYSKIEEVRAMEIAYSPIRVSAKLLESQQDSKSYAASHRMQFRFTQPQRWMASAQQQQVVDETNAVSVVESSRVESSKGEEGNTRKRILLKGRLQRQMNETGQSLLKQSRRILKVSLQLGELSKSEYSVMIRYDDASNQLEWRKCEKNKTIVWECDIKFNLIEDNNTLTILILH